MTDLASYFLKVKELHQRACKSRVNTKEHFFDIAGQKLRVVFAGLDLAQSLTPALSHLRLAARPPRTDLTIFAFDTGSTGIQMPPPPWSWSEHGFWGELPGLCTNRFKTAFDVETRSLSLADLLSGEALFWTKNSRSLTIPLLDKPFLTILRWWLHSQGKCFIHAGGVSHNGHGVLLAGQSGAGKSTAAFACLDSKLKYSGDDFCLLAPGERPVVFGLFNSGKIFHADMPRFPFLSDLKPLVDPSQDKGLFFIHDAFPKKISRSFIPKALMLVRRKDRVRTTLTAAPAVRGMVSLVPVPLFSNPDQARHAFHDLSRTVRHLPCYFLDSGRDLRTIPEAILGYLSSVT